MNHGYYSVFDKYMTLVLYHWKFATNKPLALQGHSLPVANFLRPQTRVVYLSNISTSHGLCITYTYIHTYIYKIYKNLNLRKEVGIAIKVRKQVVSSNQLEIAIYRYKAPA